jgi:hypothetical protein
MANGILLRKRKGREGTHVAVDSLRSLQGGNGTKFLCAPGTAVAHLNEVGLFGTPDRRFIIDRIRSNGNGK